MNISNQIMWKCEHELFFWHYDDQMPPTTWSSSIDKKRSLHENNLPIILNWPNVTQPFE